MEISITHELQCQALLAMRFAQGKVCREEFDDAPDTLSYTLVKGDPLPEGMIVGEMIDGELTLVGDHPSGVPSGVHFLPMYVSTQG